MSKLWFNQTGEIENIWFNAVSNTIEDRERTDLFDEIGNTYDTSERTSTSMSSRFDNKK